MSDELAALKITMQDATKTYDERIKAAEDYLAKVKPLYDQIEAEAKRMEDAHLSNWLKGTGLGDTEQVRADLRKFLVEIGQNTDMLEQLAQYSDAQRTIDKGANALGSNYGDVNQAYKDRAAVAREVAAMRERYSTDIIELFRVYNDMRGDKDTAPLVQAMVDAFNAAGLYNRETQEIQSVMNGLVNQAATAAVTEAAKNVPKDVATGLQKELNSFIKDMSLSLDKVEIGLEVDDADLAAVDELLNSITDEYFAAHQHIMDFNNAIAQSIEDTLITSMSNGLQAITDMMFGLEGADMRGVLAAFIAPLGDTMKQMGAMIMSEGIAMTAFKKSITNPAAAIAAGAALMAIGSAVSSGLQRLTANPGGGTGYSSGSSASAGVQNYESEMTIYVEGKISGSDIVLAGNKTLKNWRR
jgi:small-conductance mechanosensitive channel